MLYSNKVQAKLLNAYNECEHTGKTVIIQGESGIGKSHCSRRFLDLVEKNVFVINVNGLFVEQSAYSTINSSVYKHISERAISKEITFSMLQKIASGIPRFGYSISALLDNSKQHNAIINLIKKSGISPNEPNIYNIISFFEDLAEGKKVVLYCDNIQWFDKDSWRLIINLISSVPECKWLCILVYTTNAEVIQLSHYDIQSSINYLQSNPNIEVIEMERLPENDMGSFCQDILGLPINLSKRQVDIIYEYSKGVPYYIKTILQLLKDGNYVVLDGDTWVGKGDWQIPDISKSLKDCINERITAIYRKIPGSRNTLELASVFGEEFQESSLDDLFETKDSFELLSSIEAKFRLVQYLVNDRSWMFEHSLIKSYIYNSIGVKVKEFHLKIAKYLENTTSSDFIKISMHFELGGESGLATIYKLKEIEQLLISGCYAAASELISKVSEDWVSLFALSDEKKIEFEILKGKTKFHIVQYESAIEIFIGLLSDVNTDIEIKALSHRWLGRTYSKLNTQKDFQDGLSHLESAKKYYESLNKYEDLGFVYADLVVTYAHLNRIDEAKEAFKKAEHYFNNTKNILGMLRLQRRNVIFMEPKLSAVILEKTGNTFAKMNLPNEQIMTYNNSATQYIYSGDLEKAKNLLLEALSVSINLGGFGQVYIYNNLGILSYVDNNLDEAANFLNSARSARFRHVEQLIIDINESVILSKILPIDSMLAIFTRVYRKALEVGENDYVVPAVLNLAKCTGRLGNWQEAKRLLIEIKGNVESLNSDYEYYMWYSVITECLNALSDDSILVIEHKIKEATIDNSRHNPLYNSDFSLITMQFWSDN